MIGIGTFISFDSIEDAQKFYNENVADEKIVKAFGAEEDEIYKTLSEEDRATYLHKLRTIVNTETFEERTEYRNEFDENILTTMEK